MPNLPDRQYYDYDRVIESAQLVLRLHTILEVLKEFFDGP